MHKLKKDYEPMLSRSVKAVKAHGYLHAINMEAQYAFVNETRALLGYIEGQDQRFQEPVFKTREIAEAGFAPADTERESPKFSFRPSSKTQPLPGNGPAQG